MEDKKYANVRRRLEQERRTTALQRRRIADLEKLVKLQETHIQTYKLYDQKKDELIAECKAQLQTKDREISRLRGLLEALSVAAQDGSKSQGSQDICQRNSQEVGNDVEDDDDDKTIDEFGSSPFRPTFHESPTASRLRRSISFTDTHYDASSPALNNRFPVSPIRTSDLLLHDVGNLRSPLRHCSSSTRERAQTEKPRQALSESGEQPFVDVARRKSERDQLPADACRICAPFYLATGNVTGPDGRILTPYDRIQMTCRHRQRFKRPSTPPGYWDLDFISTQQIEEAARRRGERAKKEDVLPK